MTTFAHWLKRLAGNTLRQTGQRKPPRRCLALAVEALETRAVPTCFVSDPIAVVCDGGNDRIEVRAGGGLVDRILILNNGVTLANFPRGLVTINAGAGTNSLLINDAGLNSGVRYNFLLAPTPRVEFNGAGVAYSNVAGVTLLTGNGDDVIDLQVVAAPVTVASGNGNDTFSVGDVPAGLDRFAGFPLTLDGQGGTDSVRFNDQANTVNRTYTLSGTT